MNQPFLESLIAFRSLVAESDEDMRKAERAVKEAPNDSAARDRLKTLKLRMGKHYETPRKQPSGRHKEPVPFRGSRVSASNPYATERLKTRFGKIEDKIHHYNTLDRLMSHHKMSPEEILAKHHEMPGTEHYDKKHSEAYLKMSPNQRENVKDRLGFMSRRANSRGAELASRRYESPASAAHSIKARKIARLGSHLVKHNPTLPTAIRERLWHLGTRATYHGRDVELTEKDWELNTRKHSHLESSHQRNQKSGVQCPVENSLPSEDPNETL